MRHVVHGVSKPTERRQGGLDEGRSVDGKVGNCVAVFCVCLSCLCVCVAVGIGVGTGIGVGCVFVLVACVCVAGRVCVDECTCVLVM